MTPVVHCDNQASQTLYDSRHHRRRRARAALPDQPRHLAERLRRRSRADCDRRAQGHRRVSHHQGRRQAVRRGRSSSCRRTCNGCWRERMKLIKSIVRPNKVDEVKDALEKLEHLGDDGHRGPRPRQAEGPHGHLPRQGIQRQPAAEDADRGRRRRLGSSTMPSRRSSRRRAPARSATAACSCCPVEQTLPDPHRRTRRALGPLARRRQRGAADARDGCVA